MNGNSDFETTCSTHHDTPLAYNRGVVRPVTVVEVEPFSAKAKQVWSEEEKLELVSFVAHSPEAGDLIPGTGGVRKLRWSRRGTGKRGGVRVVYFFHDMALPVFLLTVYAKSDRADVSPSERRVMRKLVGELKAAYGR